MTLLGCGNGWELRRNRLFYARIYETQKKYFEADREGYIRTYPTIHENKENGKLRQLIKLLKRLTKGH
jgi:hypothetical protein